MGKYFDTLEELIKYEAEWQLAPLDQESAEMMVNTLGRELVMNALMACGPMTNLEFKKKLNDIFAHSIKILRSYF
jgi:hypothetical protein